MLLCNKVHGVDHPLSSPLLEYFFSPAPPPRSTFNIMSSWIKTYTWILMAAWQLIFQSMFDITSYNRTDSRVYICHSYLYQSHGWSYQKSHLFFFPFSLFGPERLLLFPHMTRRFWIMKIMALTMKSEACTCCCASKASVRSINKADHMMLDPNYLSNASMSFPTFATIMLSLYLFCHLIPSGNIWLLVNRQTLDDSSSSVLVEQKYRDRAMTYKEEDQKREERRWQIFIMWEKGIKSIVHKHRCLSG